MLHIFIYSLGTKAKSPFQYVILHYLLSDKWHCLTGMSFAMKDPIVAYIYMGGGVQAVRIRVPEGI